MVCIKVTPNKHTRHLNAEKSLWFIFFFSSSVIRKWSGRSQRLTKLGVFAGIHRVAVVLWEETPGGAALVHGAPAASSLQTTILVDEVKGQWGEMQNPRQLKYSEELQEYLWLATIEEKYWHLGSSGLGKTVDSLCWKDVGTLGNEFCN